MGVGNEADVTAFIISTMAGADDYAYCFATADFESDEIGETVVKGNVYRCTKSNGVVSLLYNIIGQSGYTPVRGTDYWTTADINAMHTYIEDYIDDVLLGGEY